MVTLRSSTFRDSWRAREKPASRPGRGGLVAGPLDRTEVGVVGAGHQGRAGRELDRDAAAETNGAGAIGAGGKVDGAPGRGRCVDRGLDGARIEGASVAGGAVLPDAPGPLDALRRGGDA